MIEVIGAGLGRTGTLSLKLALEQLGFGPCYHMFEVYEHPEHAVAWLAGDLGVLDGYRATVDWPGCTFWPELLAVAPEAKVVLSVRPADEWYASFATTVLRVLMEPRPRLATLADEVVGRRTFGDYSSMVSWQFKAAYVAHNRAVIEGVPSERLLVYDVADGWPPLCGFLERPVPATAFPRANDGAEFHRRHAYLGTPRLT